MVGNHRSKSVSRPGRRGSVASPGDGAQAGAAIDRGQVAAGIGRRLRGPAPRWTTAVRGLSRRHGPIETYGHRDRARAPDAGHGEELEHGAEAARPGRRVTATIYSFDIDLADNDRHVYETLALRV